MNARSQILEAIEQGLSSEDFIASLGLEPCAGCGEPVSLQLAGDAILDKLCGSCGDKERARRLNSLPKGEALLRCGVPAKYRLEESWLAAERWECDPAWPDREPASTWPASDAWSFTLAGRNGSGKSMIAGELLLAFWRSGARPATVPGGELPLPMWITETMLVEEAEISGYDDPRHLRQACRLSPVLVWDELGASWTTPRARRICEGLIVDRHGKSRPTIFNTDRPLTAEKAQKLGIDEGLSIEVVSPKIYSRLRDGWIGSWMSKTWRGTGDEVPA